VPRNKLATEAWEALFRAQVTVMRRLNKHHRRSGLPVREYDVLYNLSIAPGRQLRLRDLNEQILLSQPSLSRLVERMEADGLVSRCGDPSDRRGTVIRLTEDGLQVQRAFGLQHVRVIGEYVGNALTAEELRTLRTLCDKLRHAQAHLPEVP
jgi:DNA-binding MarR family transcriptional regulator